MSYNYLPIPPRVWSRVQKPCTYTDACGNYDIDYNKVYIPLTNQTVTQAQANYEDKMIYKGNILQYKGNSSRLTKSQKYSQLARMAGPNRTKVFATQGQTYTNPNTTGLQRVNYSTIPFPNGVVGAPNNISGPYQYNVTNPNGCNGVSIQDGGTLKCGYYTNPCTGEIIRSGATSATIYNPASASDVPGSSILFWNNKVETWFPKSQYFMNNSTDKWPVNYKGFVSAAGPEAPVLSGSGDCGSVSLSWTYNDSSCIPISGFNIYQNNVFIKTVSVPTTTTTIDGLGYNAIYRYYINSISYSIESKPSNLVSVITYPLPPPTDLAGIITYYIDDVSILLDWKTPVELCFDSVSGYYIYVDNLQSTPYVITPSSTTTTTITDLSYNTSYTFYIRSYAVSGGTTYYSTDSSVNITTSVLEPPEALSATPGCAYVDLTWSDPTTTPSSSYNIYYYNGAFIANVSSTSYTVSDLSYNTAYQFSVSSYNLGVSSELVSTSQVTTSQLNTPILAIDSYNASTLSITLNLSYGSSGCTSNPYSYKLYGGDTSPIDIPSNGQPTPYTLNLSYSTTYTLYITYIADNNQESPQSNTITVNTNINPPTNVVATITSPTTASLSWTAPSNFVTGYTISQSINGGSYSQLGTSSSTSFSVSNLTLSQGSSYQFSVVANYNNENSSPAYSNTIGLTAFTTTSQLLTNPTSGTLASNFYLPSGYNSFTFVLYGAGGSGAQPGSFTYGTGGGGSGSFISATSIPFSSSGIIISSITYTIDSGGNEAATIVNINYSNGTSINLNAGSGKSVTFGTAGAAGGTASASNNTGISYNNNSIIGANGGNQGSNGTASTNGSGYFTSSGSGNGGGSSAPVGNPQSGSDTFGTPDGNSYTITSQGGGTNTVVSGYGAGGAATPANYNQNAGAYRNGSGGCILYYLSP